MLITGLLTLMAPLRQRWSLLTKLTKLVFLPRFRIFGASRSVDIAFLHVRNAPGESRRT